MKVYIAGATGVIGRRAVAAFRAAGAEVTGIARSPAKRAELERMGARAAEVDLFDRQALVRAVAGHDVVVNLATHIPTGERANDLANWATNDRIRTEGARNLVDAALGVGARAYVQESIAFLYADGGDAVLDESARVEPTQITVTALEAEGHAARFAEAGGTGVALRFGYYYGPDSAHTLNTLASARSGGPIEFGPAQGFRPTVMLDDAAAAVVAAVRAPSGVYNVTDDRPLTRAEHVAALSTALGGVPLPAPVEIELPAPWAMLQWSHRVANGRFRAVTGWAPRFPSVHEGWPHVLAEVGAEAAAAAGR